MASKSRLPNSPRPATSIRGSDAHVREKVDGLIWLALRDHLAQKPFVAQPSLNDSCIRQALIQKLTSQELKPRAVIEELRVHNGNAVADVVALFQEAHCFEIKGATDKIERVVGQSIYYNASFRRITLVTTEAKRRRALEIAPLFWGIMIASADKGEITFRHVRHAKQNPQFSKQLALMTLWKSEMLRLISSQKHHREPRNVLAQLISSTTKKAELSTRICEILLGRQIAQIGQRIPLSTV